MQQEQKVPENTQRRVARDTKVREQRVKDRVARRTKNVERRAHYLKVAEAYEKEYHTLDRFAITESRKARAEGGFYVPAEAKLILVVRIRGVTCLSPQVRQTLRLLRLRQLHNAALVRVNKASIEMLRKVEPYITYGYPSRKLVHDLVYKRGFAKVNGQRHPIHDNLIIEQNLSKVDITCIEDLLHELVTVGPNFKTANSFLWPFKLNPPRGGYRHKRHPFQNKGDWGNREDLINNLVKNMI